MAERSILYKKQGKEKPADGLGERKGVSELEILMKSKNIYNRK